MPDGPGASITCLGSPIGSRGRGVAQDQDSGILDAVQ